MESIEVSLLKRARKLIENGKETFLCLAIDAVADEDNSSVRCAIWWLRDRILRALNGKLTVDCWLQQNVTAYAEWRATFTDDIGVVNYLHPEYIKTMKQYRLRWIDALIEEYSHE